MLLSSGRNAADGAAAAVVEASLLVAFEHLAVGIGEADLFLGFGEVEAGLVEEDAAVEVADDAGRVFGGDVDLGEG